MSVTDPTTTQEGPADLSEREQILSDALTEELARLNEASTNTKDLERYVKYANSTIGAVHTFGCYVEARIDPNNLPDGFPVLGSEITESYGVHPTVITHFVLSKGRAGLEITYIDARSIRPAIFIPVQHLTRLHAVEAVTDKEFEYALTLLHLHWNNPEKPMSNPSPLKDALKILPPGAMLEMTIRNLNELTIGVNSLANLTLRKYLIGQTYEGDEKVLVLKAHRPRENYLLSINDLFIEEINPGLVVISRITHLQDRGSENFYTSHEKYGLDEIYVHAITNHKIPEGLQIVLD